MYLQFKSLIIHNFGSYEHAEICLNNKGFCLVSGENHCKKDNALSNGSGKSFIWSALCYALTGETTNGLKSNLKNINTDLTDSYVTVNFNCDKDNYIITRVVAPKTDLKISKNNTDISGKGIRESEKILGDLLPDITKDLINSCIILGQGMPNKLSSFSPSGRKELLEKLTKSDFMIEDIKLRLVNRQQVISKQIREFEDSILVNSTQLKQLETDIANANQKLTALQTTDLTVELLAITERANNLQESYTQTESQITELENTCTEINSNLITILNKKSEDIDIENKNYFAQYNNLNSKKSLLIASISALKTNINKLHSITDICPTCGQKIPNIIKPDTSKEELELSELEIALNSNNKELDDFVNKHTQIILSLNNKYDSNILALKNNLNSNQSKLNTLKTSISTIQQQLVGLQNEITKLTIEKNNLENYKVELTNSITNLTASHKKTVDLINLSTLGKIDLDQHLAVLKKMDTLTKRDFRGFLLYNIIDYMNNRAKDYSEIVFGTRDLNIYLDGNALDISYCNKLFDNLSGGEKQRVDLIIQFTIRDMLNLHLNISSNLLVLDEITDFLDKQSCAAIMQLISTELNSVESVFIVSHHVDELEIPVDTELRVIKNENGISEIY